jgi:hypothetical protein
MTDEETQPQKPERNTDGRSKGDFETRYHGAARTQIIVEFAYLLAVGAFAGWMLWSLIACVVHLEAQTAASSPAVSCPWWGGCTVENAPLIMFGSFFFSGVIGGAAFSLKWLYHTVAREFWHKDRFVWRVTVPPMGGVLALIVSFIFARTLGTSYNADGLNCASLAPAWGLSFIVGVFADGVLATLERLARSVFGTLENMNRSD